MKTLRYIIIFLATAMVTPSCVDDLAPEDAYGAGPNLAGFSENAKNLTAVANGEEFEFDIPMKVKGPSLETITAPVTATITVDPSSTAIQDVHFRLESNEITFDPNNNLLNNFTVTVLTDGIEPPLAQAPTLVLNVSTVSGASNVIANARKLSINLLYLCHSDLAGDYIVSITRSDNGQVYVYPETIVKTGDGQYRGSSVAHYAPGSIGGEPGFDFVDVCGVITVPEQNLVNLYSNLVYGIESSYVLPNGDLHIEYEVTFAAGNRQYVAEYVKQ